jgi:hypothetical protein
MKKIVYLYISLLISSNALAQEIKQAEKFVGTWNYTSNLGSEVWKLEEGVLIGEAYRRNRLGDSTKVEDIRIKRIGKLTSHEWITYNIVEDSLLINSSTFIGQHPKLEFFNVDGVTPYSIAYSFGFLNRNKLIINIKYGAKEKAIRFKLIRVKS